MTNKILKTASSAGIEFIMFRNDSGKIGINAKDLESGCFVPLSHFYDSVNDATIFFNKCLK